MSSKLSQPLVPFERIDSFVQIEMALIISGLAVGSWIVSKVFFREISEERSRTLRNLFRNLFYHLFIGTLLFVSYFLLHQVTLASGALERVMTYLGLGTIFSGAITFVKTWRVLVFQYLFLSHRRVAFPVLLVNLFTLLLSILLVAWIGAEIFNIRLAPLLATSAIFSLVLGLALQDTLGNLFAGVALQFDKPYEIGDWIEVHSSGQKWVGQVFEISWRATVLIATTEESITVPNRIMGQAQILNFSSKYRPIIRSQIFRLPFNVEISKAKEILVKTARSVPEIRKNPSPKVIIWETTESWISFKLIYFIDNYGEQFFIADQIYSKCLTQLREEGLELATHQVTIHGSHSI